MFKQWIIGVMRALGLEERARESYYRIMGRIIPKTVSIRGVPTKCYIQSAQSADSLRIMPEEAQVQDWLARQLRLGDVVWDIGANVGQWGVYCARIVGEKGRVYCFEPDRRLASNLRKTLNANGLKCAEVCAVALGSCDGVAELFQGVRDPTINSLSPRADGLLVHRRGVRVPLRSAHSLVDSCGMKLPAAIKVDVEGWELEVLKGFNRSIWQACRALVIEVHPLLLSPKSVSLDDIRNLLKSNCFVIERVVERSTIEIWMCLRAGSRSNSKQS